MAVGLLDVECCWRRSKIK